MLRKKIVQSFYIANIAATVSGLVLCLVPVCNTKSELLINKILLIAVPVIFWLGIIISQVFLWISNNQRKKYMIENNIEIKDSSLGIISFAKNKYGIVADVLFLVSAITVIVMYITRYSNEWVNMIAIAAMVLGFQYHCFWNGRISYCVLKLIYDEKR